jgi:thioredoxin reductase (NADPH)
MYCRKQTVVLCFITGCGLKQNSENIGLDRIKGKGETMSHIYDLIIIGSGPAGLAAAVYAQRAKLDTLVVEKAMVSGGQVLTTYEVDNYPGLPGIGGYDLGIKFREHADRLGARFVEDEVLNIQDGGKGAIKGVVCQGNTYEARSLILATGAVHRKLGVPGEEELAGAGVSYCATCDGAFFRNKVTAVIGGGDVAVEDAIFLARMCSKVYLIHRRNELRAAKSLQENLLSLDNVEVIWDTVADSINGDGMVKSLSLTNVKNGQKRELDVQGVFIAVGITPESRAFEGLVDMDHGYIRAGEDTVTSAPGIFAAGDVRTKPLRQIITAAADGANAITSVERYLVEN